jgi:divalent metal cation (Fe/Co/Zn/Cd) transporter
MLRLSANSPQLHSSLILVQSLTLLWMLIECAVSLFSAARAHSPALLAFGFDSFVELLSAALVLVALAPRFHLDQRPINRASGALLFMLAAIVAFTAILALAHKFEPAASPLGIAITIAAFLIMPLLARQKRKLSQTTHNSALAADAVQSATCAYLAAISLAGLALNARFHIAWADSAAALTAIPILIIEGRRAMRGQSCRCC